MCSVVCRTGPRSLFIHHTLEHSFSGIHITQFFARIRFIVYRGIGKIKPTTNRCHPHCHLVECHILMINKVRGKGKRSPVIGSKLALSREPACRLSGDGNLPNQSQGSISKNTEFRQGMNDGVSDMIVVDPFVYPSFVYPSFGYPGCRQIV